MPPQDGLTPEQIARIRAKLGAPGAKPGQKANAAPEDDDLLSKAARLGEASQVPLSALSFVSAIPHWSTKLVGRLAQAGFTLGAGAQAADAYRKGDTTNALVQGAVAATPLIFHGYSKARAAAAAKPGAVPKTSAAVEDLIERMKAARGGTPEPPVPPAPKGTPKPNAPKPATLPSASRPPKTATEIQTAANAERRRLLREARLTIRNLTKAGQEIPEELAALAADAAFTSTSTIGGAVRGAAKAAKTAAAKDPIAAALERAAPTQPKTPPKSRIKKLAEMPTPEGQPPAVATGGKGTGTAITAEEAAINRAKLTPGDPTAIAPGTPDPLTAVVNEAKVTARPSRPKAAPEVVNTVNTAKAVATRLNKAKPEAADAINDLVSKLEESLAKPTNPAQAKAAKDAGFAMTQILTHLAGAGIGAATGAAVGDEMRPADSDRSPGEYRAAGAISGALLGLLAGNLAATPGTVAKLAKVRDYNFFSLLSAPQSIARANMGSLMSVVIGSMEKMHQGDFIAAKKILGTLMRDVESGTWFKALASKDPSIFLPAQAARQQFGRAAKVSQTKGLLGLPAHAIAAGDVVSTRALMAGGYKIEDILRMNLSGDPQSRTGRGFLRALGVDTERKILDKAGNIRTKKEKALALDGPWGQLLARWFIPFARVSAAVPERMVAYSPLGLTNMARRTLSSVPGQMVPLAEARAKAAIGSGLGIAGYGLGGVTSPEVDPFTVALGGPTAGMVGLGLALRRLRDRDQPLYAALIQQAGDILPLVGEQLRGPQERIVPAIVKNLAEGMDPAYDREKGPGAVTEARRRSGAAGEPSAMESLKEIGTTVGAGIAARLPVIREALPEAYMPVDTFGRPLYPTDRPTWIPDITLRGDFGGPKIVAPKILTSKPMVGSPQFPLDDPLAQNLRSLQREAGGAELISPPSPAIENPKLNEMAALTGRPNPRMHRDVRLDIQRATGAASERPLEAIFNSPAFAALPPAQRAVIVRRMVEQSRGSVSDALGQLGTASMAAPDAQPQIRQAIQALIAGLQRSK